MENAKPLQVRCRFCATLIPASATVCWYCERPTGLVVMGVADAATAQDSHVPADPAPRSRLHLIVGIIFGLCCLAVVLYGVYVMAQ